MTRTNHIISSVSFVADPLSVAKDPGRQVDWDLVASDGTYGDTGSRVIPAGTVLAEAADGKVFPRADVDAGGETAIGLAETFMNEGTGRGARSDALTGYGVFRGGLFYEQLIPENAEVGFAGWIGEIDDAGPGIALVLWEDTDNNA